jgi:ribosomal protein L11
VTTVAADKQTTWSEFRHTVNMTAAELEKWLDTAESKEVGQKSNSKESTGHASGRHIVAILKAKKNDLTDGDYAHMRKVVGYAKRHLAQRPSGATGDIAWRYSLMNWGHDPTKK